MKRYVSEHVIVRRAIPREAQFLQIRKVRQLRGLVRLVGGDFTPRRKMWIDATSASVVVPTTTCTVSRGGGGIDAVPTATASSSSSSSSSVAPPQLGEEIFREASRDEIYGGC